ncbi:MAG TPA: hypothetical protein VFG30_34945 [Polyangiales bacterium]|nr:hypothetical protein [Polyangiales bacterium]
MRNQLVTIVFTASLALACNDEVDLNAATSTAFISGHASVDSSCKPQLEQVVGSGMFDIGLGHAGGSPGSCSSPYTLNLIVDSESDELTLFDQAEVTIRESESLIPFDQTPEPLPNPFKVLTAGRIARDAREGVVSVAVIPRGYADQLTAYVDKSISVEVRLTGATQSGKRQATQVFRFPVSICSGCLIRCVSTIAEGDTDEDIYGDECADNAGADGRVCLSHDC